HALARVLRRHGAAYSSHIRDEANHVTDAVREAIAVAEATGVHVQIAHLKLSGVDNWGGAARLLDEIAAARRRGLAVDCDAYPYDTASHPLRNLFPRWVMDGGTAALLERRGRPEGRPPLPPRWVSPIAAYCAIVARPTSRSSIRSGSAIARRTSSDIAMPSASRRSSSTAMSSSTAAITPARCPGAFCAARRIGSRA